MTELSELDLGSKRLRPYQCELIEKVRDEIRKGRKRIIICAPTGSGKCLGKGTPVLMFNGTIKAAENVSQGDLLMGPDSQPRRVLSTCTGTEMLYKVIPVKGDPYIINESHVLSLRRTSDGKSSRGGEIVNICVTDYLKSSKTFKHMHKGWRTGIDFQGSPTLPLDPYYLGLWLADGTSQNTAVTTPDQEIVKWLEEYAKSFGLTTRVEYNSENSVVVYITSGIMGGPDPRRNKVLNHLKDMKLIGNKHVPEAYKTASRENRLRLLAGYLDGDGHLSRGSFDCISVRQGLMDDILFVARSLGFSAYKKECRKTCCNNGVTGTYWRGSIGGDLDRIPCMVPRRKAAPRRQKKNVLVTGISIQPIGVGEYFGFEIDGDGLFLLGDFTVTHNTTITCGIIKLSAMRGSLSMFMAPRRELLRQTADHLIDCDVKYSFIAAGMGEQMAGSECLVVSKDTLHHRAVRRSKIPIPTTNVLAVDEAHLSLAPKFIALLLEIEKANPGMITLGLSATPGRADGKGLGDFWETIVTAAGYEELRELGFLVPARVFLGYAPDMKGVRSIDWESEAAKRVDKPKLVGDIVENWLRYASDRKTFVFGATQSHATHLRDEFLKAGIRAAHVDDTTPPEERAQAFSDLRTGEIQVLTNVEICTYGIDVPEVSCVVLASPCRSLVRYRQRCGRALRPFEGKQDCIVLDHAGGVVMHGFPDEDIEWPLEKSRSIDQEYQKKRNEGGTKEPIICTACGCAYSGMPVCPNCGSRQARQGRAIAVERGLLKEIKREKRKIVVNSFEQKQKYWNQCLAIMARKGRTCGAAAQMYSRKIGVPPWQTKGLQRVPRFEDWKKPVSKVYPTFAPKVQNEPE